MKKPRLTIQNFHDYFPDNDVCLDHLFHARHPNPVCPVCGQKGKYHRERASSRFVCQCGRHQISPKQGTIFHKSDTDLVKWFFAIFLMSQSRNGVAAKEIERHVGVTYKTAWRMMHQIRKLMKEDPYILAGDVEADETMIGGKRKGKRGRGAEGKTIVFGKVERGGKVQVEVVPDAKAATLLPHVEDNVAKGAKLLTDEFTPYKKIAQVLDMDHDTVNHGKKKYVKGKAHTNTIEGFWSQIHRSLDGTHHVISPKYLSSYVSEFAWRYNHRDSERHLFEILLERVSFPLGGAI